MGRQKNFDDRFSCFDAIPDRDTLADSKAWRRLRPFFAVSVACSCSFQSHTYT